MFWSTANTVTLYDSVIHGPFFFAGGGIADGTKIRGGQVTAKWLYSVTRIWRADAMARYNRTGRGGGKFNATLM